MRLIFITALTASLLVPHAHAQVSGIKNVYVLPMSGGLDQFLALRLAAGGVLQVVTDPQKADVILTDRIGGHFEQTYQEMFAPKPTEKDKKDGNAEFAHPGMQPLRSARGAVFLIDRSTRNVLWSTFELSKNSTPEEMNRTAGKIVDQLAKSQKGKQ